MWLPIVLGGNPKNACPPNQTGSGINFHNCSYGSIAEMSDISKTVTDITMVSMEVEYETIPGLSDWHYDLSLSVNELC